MGFFYTLFGFVIVISAMGMFADYRKQQLKIMAKMNEMEQGQLQRELAEIKQRLVVLEKIVTDKHYDLRDEFAKL